MKAHIDFKIKLRQQQQQIEQTCSHAKSGVRCFSNSFHLIKYYWTRQTGVEIKAGCRGTSTQNLL